jgi:hypothetical protein
MGRPLKIKESTTVDIGFNIFSLLDSPTQVIPAGMTSSQYLGVVGGGFPGGIATPTFPTVRATAFFPVAGETPAYIITQKGVTKYQVASNNAITAGSFVPGNSYVIKTLGNTNFSAVGASYVSPQVGDVFTATGVGSGTGTVSSVTTCALSNAAPGALVAGQMQITVTTTSGTFRASKLTNKFVWDYATPATKYAANFFVAGGAANPLTTVAITGTAGQFSCAADTLAVGQAVTVSGTLTGTGTITGYASPTTYYIVATNGTTTFTLSTTPGGAGVVTTAGTTVGLTFGMPGAVVAKSGAQISTWANGTGNLALAEVSDYTA